LLGLDAEAREAGGPVTRVQLPDAAAMNAQVRNFRGGADSDTLMLWRFER
jgi:hypothetical protein